MGRINHTNNHIYVVMYSLFVKGKVEKKQHVGGANEDGVLDCRNSLKYEFQYTWRCSMVFL